MANVPMKTLQIETTSRCTLKCPACSRTWWNQTLKKGIPISDIDIEMLYKFLDCEKGREIKMLDLRGDWGDCIYYPKLFDFIDKFRKEKNFTICTNGAWQTEKFWNRLSAILVEGDVVEFSIDGLEDTNHLYRRNSDWKSLMLALRIIKNSKARMVWKTRVFKFNQNILPEMKKTAEDLGAEFSHEITHRFGDESLRPTENFVDEDWTYKPDRTVNKIVPRCKRIDEYNYPSVSYYNMFFPCGWFCAPQVLYKSELWKNREKWMIKDTTLDEMWENVVLPWAKNIEDNPAKASILCQTKCNASLQDRNTAVTKLEME